MQDHPFWQDMAFLIGLRRGVLLGWLVGLGFLAGVAFGVYFS